MSADPHNNETTLRKETFENNPAWYLALFPLTLLLVLLTLNVQYFGDSSSMGANQLALILSASLTMAIGLFKLKISYDVLEKRMIKTIHLSLQACLILFVVGSLISLWIASGVVPTMVYYGVKLIHPSWFLPLTLVSCSLVSLVTGSSWSTVGTLGVALIAVAKTMGIDPAMVAGAIVSGAYFGDKLSALSDTTNLASAVSGVDLFDHIKHMTYTTIPTYLITLILFSFLSFGTQSENFLENNLSRDFMIEVQSTFSIGPWLLFLPLIVFTLVKKKVSALPALVIGAILGAVFTLIFQQDFLNLMMQKQGLTSWYQVLIQIAYDGVKLESDHPFMKELLSRGGMSSMLNTVWLIMSAMVFGGAMEATGLMQSLAFHLISFIKRKVTLIFSAVTSGIFFNLTTGDQYISIVMSSKMFKHSFKQKNISALYLARASEDGATVTSVLVPWNSCGAYFASVMGVATLAYVPYSFFNLLSPIMSVIVGFLAFRLNENKTT